MTSHLPSLIRFEPNLTSIRSYTIACFASALIVAVFVPAPQPLNAAPPPVSTRPAIFLVYDLITNRASAGGGGGGGSSSSIGQSNPRLIWCFLPFNILFGFAAALFTFWINGAVATAAGCNRNMVL